MKGVSILGSTGSIGTQTLDVVRLHPDRFRVTALAAGGNVDLLEKQAREFRPDLISCGTESAAMELTQRLAHWGESIAVEHSAKGLEQVATHPAADIVVAGLPGSTGLSPTFAAVEAGKDVALATKEVLVMAGRLFMASVKAKGVALLPVDSEQSAIFQCLEGNRHASVRRILLTASGGPFLDTPVEVMCRVTPEQALDHPRWKMGPKVTIDSSTLMNKGLEVIEAAMLFDVPGESIEVVIHPQSICHSMVEFWDGSVIAQLGTTDMRIPICYALSYPDRIESGADPVSFPALGSLDFQEPDLIRFPLLRAAYDALEAGESAGVVLNAADEVAVEFFLSKRIGFSDIPRIVLEALESITAPPLDTLEEIMAFHEEVVDRVRKEWE